VVLVTATLAGADLPREVMIPMRLIGYNGGGRRLVLRAGEQVLPASVVEWLQGAVEYRGLVVK
jgi:hypothetical protein